MTTILTIKRSRCANRRPMNTHTHTDTVTRSIHPEKNCVRRSPSDTRMMDHGDRGNGAHPPDAGSPALLSAPSVWRAVRFIDEHSILPVATLAGINRDFFSHYGSPLGRSCYFGFGGTKCDTRTHTHTHTLAHKAV